MSCSLGNLLTVLFACLNLLRLVNLISYHLFPCGTDFSLGSDFVLRSRHDLLSLCSICFFLFAQTSSDTSL